MSIQHSQPFVLSLGAAVSLLALTGCLAKESGPLMVQDSVVLTEDEPTDSSDRREPWEVVEVPATMERESESLRAVDGAAESASVGLEGRGAADAYAGVDASSLSVPAPSAAQAKRSAGTRARSGVRRPAPSVFPPAPSAPPVSYLMADDMSEPPSPEAMIGSHTDHGVGAFTLTADDALSTFSIDVDTASYSMARRMLNDGTLPAEAAVRVEEFVNYFDFGSYRPPAGDPFAVDMEAMPDPFRPGHHVLRVGVQGQEVDRDARPPVHLVFLVDVSGSMSSADKLGYAKKALHMLVDRLREDDTVGLCTYAGRVARVLEPTSAMNKRAIHAAIEGLKSGGSTAMSSGIDLAYDMASEELQAGHENRVVILSDGDANVGRSSWDELLSQIKKHADRGVTLSTIGLGTGNYRDNLMEQLANNGDGNNFYIDSMEQAKRVFVEQLGGTMVTIARDVKIQVEFDPDAVAAYRLIGYENRDIADADFRNDRVDAGEVGSGHSVTALYDVILRDKEADSFGKVRMRYEAPGPDSVATERLWSFSTSDLRATPAMATRDTRIAYSAATFAEVLRGSPHASEIDLEALGRFATWSQRPDESEDDGELVALIQRAAQLGAGPDRLVRR